MSEKKNHPENVTDLLSEEELDRMLAQMAQETPEAPDDFHSRWTEGIRKEAAGQPRAGKRGEGRKQWRYLLSAAAVFVFLIGGTLLTRNHGADRADTAPVAGNASVMKAEATAEPEAPMEPEATPGLLTAAGDAPAAETAGEGAAWFAAKNAAPMVPAAMDAAYEAAEMMMAGTAAEKPAMEEASEDPAMEEVVEESAMEETAEEPAPEPAAGEALRDIAETAAAADAAAAEAAAEVTETAVAGEAPQAPEGENEIIAFLKDLGVFTLKTLAAATVAAALAFAAAAVHRAWKKHKGKGRGKNV